MMTVYIVTGCFAWINTMFTNSYTCKYIEDDNCASVKVEGMKEKQKIVSCTVCGLIEKYLFHLPQ